MTLLFAKSYKNDALHELEVEAVPRLQLRQQFPPLRADISESPRPRTRGLIGKDATLHSCDS